MIGRKKFQMPITTNSIENLHGHLNETTQRNNIFYHSIYRLIIFINSSIRHFYNTSVDKCECDETILYWSMYRSGISCSHRIFLREQFPKIDNITLILNKQFDEQIEHDKLKEITAV